MLIIIFSYLGFQRCAPSRSLAAYVDCYWFIDNGGLEHRESKEFLHPNGGTGIIFNFGDALTFEDKPNADSCILDGTNTLSRVLSLSGTIKAAGIRFKPAGATLFFHYHYMN